MSWWSYTKVITGFINSDQRLMEFEYFFLLGLTAWFFIWVVVVAMGYDSSGINALKRAWLIGMIPIGISIWHYYWVSTTTDSFFEWSTFLNVILAGSGGIFIIVSRSSLVARIAGSSFVKKFIKGGNNPISGWLSFIAGKLWKVFAFAFLFAFLMAFPFIGRIFGILNLTLIHGFSNYPGFFFQAITLAVVFGIIPQIVYSWILIRRIKERERITLKRINKKSQFYEFEKGVVEGMKDAEEILEDNKFDQARDDAQLMAEKILNNVFDKR